MGRVTLQTIADHLGVSRTTVSNAWSKPDQLSADLRDRIHAVATELGYAGPDPAARTLRSGRVGAIGLLLNEPLRYAFTDEYAQDILRGVGTATETADMGLLLVPLPPGREVGEALRSAVVDGVIVYTMPEEHPALELLRRRGLPLVTIDSPRLPDVPFVGIDDRAATRDMTQRVLDTGHRRIVVLSFMVADDQRDGVVDDERIEAATFRLTAERLLGILDATTAAGVERGAVEIRELSTHARERARAEVAEVLRRDHPPTAIVALSDLMALGALDAARAQGLRVPEDLSVVGFDDVPMAAAHHLTTVRQPSEEKGRRAADALLGRSGGDVLLPHTIVDRGSLGPAG